MCASLLFGVFWNRFAHKTAKPPERYKFSEKIFKDKKAAMAYPEPQRQKAQCTKNSSSTSTTAQQETDT